MLIKRQKLAEIKGLTLVSSRELTEVQKVSQLEIQKAKQEANTITQNAQNYLTESQNKLKEAEKKRDEIIQSAKEEAKRIKETTYRETLTAAKEEIEQIKTRSKELIRELFRVKNDALLEAHKEILDIALKMAEKIIKQEVTTNKEILKTQVIEAIKKATTEADRVQVFVNPCDINELREFLQYIERLFPSGIDIVALENEEVDPGSSIIETKSGRLDASFKTQLKTLRELTSHFEIKEPQITEQEEAIVQEEPQDIETLAPLDVEISEPVELESISPLDLDLLETPSEALTLSREDEKEFEEELLTDTPLLTQDIERFEEQEFVLELPKEEPSIESTIPVIEPEEEIITQDQVQDIAAPGKKKLSLKAPVEEEKKYDFQDVEEEKKEEIDIKSILKPKKKKNGDEISKIVSEVEQSPEWKDLIEKEDEE